MSPGLYISTVMPSMARLSRITAILGSLMASIKLSILLIGLWLVLAPSVWRVIVLPSSMVTCLSSNWESRSPRLVAMMSITLSSRASVSVAETLSLTAFSAHSILRP